MKGVAKLHGGARRNRNFKNDAAVDFRARVNLKASGSFRARVRSSTPVVFVWDCCRTALPIGPARFVGPGSNTRYGCGWARKAEPHSYLPQ